MALLQFQCRRLYVCANCAQQVCRKNFADKENWKTFQPSRLPREAFPTCCIRLEAFIELFMESCSFALISDEFRDRIKSDDVGT